MSYNGKLQMGNFAAVTACMCACFCALSQNDKSVPDMLGAPTGTRLPYGQGRAGQGLQGVYSQGRRYKIMKIKLRLVGKGAGG